VNPQSILATLKVIHICADDKRQVRADLRSQERIIVGHEAEHSRNLEAGLEAEKKREHDRLFAKRNN
jgi:hypothetical protein